VIQEIKGMTGGRGVDVAIEALGTQATFENALRRCVREEHCRASEYIRENLTLPLEPFRGWLR
jgi:hypothetical protein